MQIPLGTTSTVDPQYQWSDIDKNYLGDKGLKHLSKARMPNLKVLNLCTDV
jgi:hypothetical protein